MPSGRLFMEPIIVVSLLVVTFCLGKFFPFQSARNAIAKHARENTAREVRMLMYQATELCGLYTCVSFHSQKVPVYPNRAKSEMFVVLQSDNGPKRRLKLRCDEEVKPEQKVYLRLRDPAFPSMHTSFDYGHLLDVVPI